jgi:3-carboxy-cis,cis-muconate cycloisomerase
MYYAVSDRAFLQAMLDAEAALALAEAAAGVIPREAADAIAAAADHPEEFDADAIGRAARAEGNPVPALVRALAAAVGDSAAPHVHFGAAAQDIVDTAAMLVARRGLDLIRGDLDGVADACAALADEHRATPAFGLKAAGWLAGVTDAWSALTAVQAQRLAAQLGGDAGALASLGDRGAAVLRGFAEELDLVEPALPWHGTRAGVAEIGSALAIAAGTLAKIALDAGPAADGAIVRACAMRVQAAAGVLIGALPENGGRQADWEPLREALALTGGAAATTRRVVEGLRVDRLDPAAELDLASADTFIDRALDEYRSRR